jgi:hypothetical protein
MGCWIPGPEQLCWPANQRKPQPESPHQAAIAQPVEEQPKRTRRTKKTED